MLVVCCFFFYTLLSPCRRVALLLLLHTHTAHTIAREKDEERRLEGEQQQEGHHKTEQTHSLRQGETQDGIGEQLLFQRWVSGIADDEGTEY